MYHIRKKEKLGDGTYGVVYSAEMHTDDELKEVAVKRNLCQPSMLGMSCIREMNFLECLKGHPNIVFLESVHQGNPFRNGPMTPIPLEREQSEDSHHFIFERAECTMFKYLKSKDRDLKLMKSFMCDILLGLEYCHSKSILHRDLKPDNILILNDVAKICDFGMSCRPNKYIPSTPGTVTSWYRAPEICCEHEYSLASDIWSAGCVFYQMLSSRSLITVDDIEDEDELNKELMKDILRKTPERWKKSYMKKYLATGALTKHINLKLEKKSKPFFDMLKRKKYLANFNKSPGSLNEISDLLTKMMKLDPSERPTATECLSHCFFSSMKNKIDKVRKDFPPLHWESQTVRIYDCLERRIAANIAFEIYNERDEYDWYKHNILFHGFRIFDEYLAFEHINMEEEEKLKEVSEESGKVLEREEIYLFFFTCMYIMYKFFSCLNYIDEWDYFFPSELICEENKRKVEEFEKFLVFDVCNKILFKDTFLELLDAELTKEKNEEEMELDIKNALMSYGGITSNYTGKMKRLYEKTMKS